MRRGRVRVFVWVMISVGLVFAPTLKGSAYPTTLKGSAYPTTLKGSAY